jgi:hypothetical protein
LYIIARNVCSTYNVAYCFDRSCWCTRYKHLPFQCEYNDDVTISSYIKSNSLTNTLLDRPPCLTKEGECDIYINEFVHDATEKLLWERKIWLLEFPCY